MSAGAVDLYDPRTWLTGAPHAALAEMRRAEPVRWQEEREMLGWPAGTGHWAVLRHADIVHVNRHPEVFSSHLGGTQIKDPKPADLEHQRKMMTNLDPPDHTRLRRLVARAFAPRQVARLEERIRAHARRLVGQVAGEAAFDFTRDLSADLPVFTLAEVLGVPAEDRHLLYDWANRIIGFQDPEYARYDEAGNPIDPRSRAALADMYDYAHTLAEDKRAHPADDVLTILLSRDEDGSALTDEEFENFFFLLAVAGNETLRNSIPGGMLALLDHPAEHRRLLDDPGLLPSAIEEMLRFNTPVNLFRRTAASATILGSVEIAAGQKVVVYYVSGNRDPEVFAEPDRFDVGRSPNEHLSLGAGPHFCLGAALARLQMRVFFEETLWRLAGLEQAGPVERLVSSFQAGIKRMPVSRKV